MNRRSLDRRLLLKSAASSLLLPGISRAAAQKMRVRRDIFELKNNSDDLLALKDAMKAMKGEGPLSWQKQAEIHAGHWGQHGSWLFLPWHRLQLYYFERIIIKLSGHATFALPYWNWQKHGQLPAQFLTAPLSSSPAIGILNRRASSKDRLEDYMAALDASFLPLTNAYFKDMLGSERGPGNVETSGHGFVHMFVGGMMGRIPTATHDPLFWIHHANIDRIWYAHSKRFEPVYPDDWKAQQLEGFIDENGATVPPASCVTTTDTKAFGYEYDANAVTFYYFNRFPWPGVPVAGAPKTFKARYTMERISPKRVRVQIPPEALTNMFGMQTHLEITASATIAGDGYEIYTISGGNGSTKPSARLAWAMPPMSMNMSLVHRLPLADMVPLDQAILKSGFWFEFELKPVDGEGRAIISEQTELKDLYIDFTSQQLTP